MTSTPRPASPRILASALLLTVACATPDAPERDRARVDPHSFSNPDEIAVTHMSLDLDVDFERRVIDGRAVLTLEHRTGSPQLVLDAGDLQIRSVDLGDASAPARWTVGAPEPWMGRPLTVDVTPDIERVRVVYTTAPGAAGLQWLDPGQTAGGRHPFLYSQSQAVLARTWVPCQDTPGVRTTYDATVRVPPGLLALMSAENPTTRADDGVYRFRMDESVPSYLLAIAVGDLDFRPMGSRAGVYAEPDLVDAAAWEFAETEAMMTAAERLFGPYRWGRYDLLVLPPSFPFGGMENPRLTFLTPTLLAGDRTLTSLVGHELAHSWSGNLVTNATWNDFWLNEGLTTYGERRIMEELHGAGHAATLAVLGRQDLDEVLEELGENSGDTRLFLELEGRDPDDGMSDVAYEKGYLFMSMLETSLGRDRVDAFLRGYYDEYAFRTVDTRGFHDYLSRRLLEGDAALEAELKISRWLYEPGLPDNAPRTRSDSLDRVDAQVAAFSEGARAPELDTSGWTTLEWVHFLRSLPQPVPVPRLEDLDRAFDLTRSRNSEVFHAFMIQAIAGRHEAAYPALESFLVRVGRRKFLRPLYRDLAATEEGKAWAQRVYSEARAGYHAISRNTVDEILGWEE